MKRAAALIVGASGLALGVAAPVSANPGDPCPLAASFLCAFVPIAPDLDQSIDPAQNSGILAEEPAPAAPDAPPIDYGPPADVCANGCI
ncbi:MAG: fibronectin-binding protein [Actinomycetia bacterium]|nr:fibronectin-binding protein [Actinomycetes bacterium]MCH9701289.1 fibronectin-binding protein [Actinomycetes bacterium]MCH9762186.1 fibronectin-binding protein [Actinomycetes bacterium]